MEIKANSLFFYAQVLSAGVAFFDYKSNEPLYDLEKLNHVNILFIVEVYDSVITKGRWRIVGNLPIREELKVPPLKFIQDRLNPNFFELYDPITGKTFPAKRDDCKGLERAAVWEAEHVEERLLDHYEGRENKWVKKMSIK